VRVRLLRIVVGAVVCVVLPAVSWLQGSRQFAWAMYSRAGEYRIEVVAWDAQGRARLRNPTALAEHAAPVESALLAGSDHWREGPSMAPFRTHLGELAAYACTEFGAAAVEVTLHERPDRVADRVTTQHRTCRP
jgi:hypothetical protein